MRDGIEPQYVDRNGDVVYRPPYLQAGTRLTGWVLPSQETALQKICDQALNAPSGGAVEYRPLLPMVFLVLADIQKVSSLDPRDAQRGWVPEQDICFWILTGAYKDDGSGTGKKVLDHVAFYIPYIWVTNAYTMATGRESFGYPKGFGWAQLAHSPDDPGPLWADGMVLTDYTPSTEVSRERLLTIAREGGKTPAEKPAPFGPGQGPAALAALVDRMRAMAPDGIDWDVILQLVSDVFGGHIPMVFLKQFRSACDPTAACYQAIIEANATVTQFNGAQLLPPGWTLQLKEYASAQIITDLALSASPMRADLGFWVDYSFSMDLGREVWKAGT
jgi:hypothetical protein